MRATVKDVADTEQKHTVSHLRSSCVCVRLFGVCLVLVVHLSLLSDVSVQLELICIIRLQECVCKMSHVDLSWPREAWDMTADGHATCNVHSQLVKCAKSVILLSLGVNHKS